MAEESAAAGGPSQETVQPFQPKEEFLQVLIDMGISKNAAVKALFYTGNYSADLAAAWVFENQDKDLETPLEAEGVNASDSDEDEMEDFLDASDLCKMVFVVNMGLKMGVGKVAAQVGHATLGVYRLLLEDQERYGQYMHNWEQFGETKIVLKCNTTEELVALAAKAAVFQLPSYTVQDAGRTQIAEGSITVLGIMGKSDMVDQVTGHLSLL